MSDKTELYRYYDNQDRLLYVGISFDFVGRDEQHIEKSHWYNLVDKKVIQIINTRHEALEAEKQAIISEKPLFNIQHSTTLEDFSISDDVVNEKHRPFVSLHTDLFCYLKDVPPLLIKVFIAALSNIDDDGGLFMTNRAQNNIAGICDIEQDESMRAISSLIGYGLLRKHDKRYYQINPIFLAGYRSENMVAEDRYYDSDDYKYGQKEQND